MSYLSELLGTAYKEGMSEEDISSALEKALKENNSNMSKLKTAFDKASSDLARTKKQLEDRMSEEEKQKNEQKDMLDKLIADNKAMKEKIAVTDNKARYLALGYPEELAQSSAEAMFKGDNDTVFKNQKAFFEMKEKAIREDVMTGTKGLPAGNSASPVTKEQFAKMTTMELMELYQKDQELYEKLQSEIQTN